MSASRFGPVAVVFGVLAVVAIPAGVVIAWFSNRVGLLQAVEVAVPAAFVLGLVAVAAARRARFRVERSVVRDGERLVRIARLLAFGALYLAMTGAIALGFYGLLVLRG